MFPKYASQFYLVKLCVFLRNSHVERNICKEHKYMDGVNVMEITAVMERARTPRWLHMHISRRKICCTWEKNVPVATRPINQSPSFKRVPIGHAALRRFGEIMIIGKAGKATTPRVIARSCIKNTHATLRDSFLFRNSLTSAKFHGWFMSMFRKCDILCICRTRQLGKQANFFFMKAWCKIAKIKFFPKHNYNFPRNMRAFT